MIRKSQSGQALVLVLLSLSVILTLVLFIMSRSVTDVAISGSQEESVRAFSAAEAGVEQALVTGSSISSASLGYTTTVTDFASGSTNVAFPSSVSSGDTVTVWFMAHDANGNMTSSGAFTGSQMKVCWGNAGTPAIEVSIFYEQTPGTLSSIRVARAAFDPDPARGSLYNFVQPVTGGCTIGGTSYAYSQNIIFSSFSPSVVTGGLVFAKIRMLYGASQPVGVSLTGGTLPSQGQKIDSSGVAGTSNRRILVYQSWPEFPFASNSILSPVGITQ